jgi:very-short-patch-repair endonuclease
VSPKTLEIEMARSARLAPTHAERRLWSRLRRHGVGWHFRRQHPEPPFVLDFACPALRIALEADGGQHAEPGEHDKRNQILNARGWLVLRFWNNEILGNTDGVIFLIQEACRRRAADAPPPRPSPASRERG